MAWVTLDTNNLLAGEPLVEGEVLALYENVFGAANADIGAPKWVTEALRATGFIGRVSTTGTSNQGWTDLLAGGLFEINIVSIALGSAVGTSNLEMRVSSDNGATYSAWHVIHSNDDVFAPGKVYALFDGGSGVINYHVLITTREIDSIGDGITPFLKSTTHDFGQTGVNAIQFRRNGVRPLNYSVIIRTIANGTET